MDIVEMRLTRLLPCLVLVVACGDNSNGATPVHTVDAAKQIDAPDIDGPPMSTGDGSRVWAVGDYIVDATLNGAGFKDGDKLPFDGSVDPKVLPPIVLPGGTAVLASGTNVQKAGVFDATKTKIAFIADLTTPTQFDLYVADADGTNVHMVVPSTFATTIASVQLSPDGTKVAFTADPALAGMFDLFVENADGTGTPAQLTPPRAANLATLDVFFQVTWSADSKFVAFDGQMVTAGISQAFVVDTTAATPTPVKLLADGAVTTPGVGVRGQMQFDDQDRVYFRAQLIGPATGVGAGPFHMFIADSDGGNPVTDPAFIPARGDTTASSVGAFATTADGKKLLFAADAPNLNAFNVYSVATGTTDAATNLTNFAGTVTAPVTSLGPQATAPLWLSPDNTAVAMVSNYQQSGDNEPYIVKLDGTGMTRLVDINASVTGGCVANCDVNIIQWTDSGKSLYVMGDIVVGNDTAIFKLDTTKTDQTPTPAINVLTGKGDFNTLVIR